MMKKKKAKGKRLDTVLKVLMSLVLVLAIVVNVALTGPLYTVMNMYFGKGDIIITEETDANSTYYTSSYSTAEELLAASQELAITIESEGIVLLKNDNNTLPLSSDETNVSLFGRTSVDPVYTGAGSAASENTPVDYKTALEDNGFSVNEELYSFYANHSLSTEVVSTTMMTGYGEMPVTYTGRGFVSTMGSATFTGDIIAEVPVEDYPDSLMDTYAQYGDAAIIVIGRVGGEGCDLPTDMSEHATREEDMDKTYLELDSREIEMLEYVKALKDAGTISKIIVVCNTANAMELDFLYDEAYGIDAALWVGCLGDQGSIALAQVLNGTVNPSGRLVDTYVSDLTADPSFANFAETYYTNVDGTVGGYSSGSFIEYEEGIYVGYRYYETAAAEALAGNYDGFDYDSAVVYPFGYGLSYTTFTMEYEGTPTYSDGTFTFNVTVTNTGDVSGKQVVEIYMEAPYTYGGIEKSKVVLVAFAKTSELAPGESETLTLTAERDDLASYDYSDNGCYVLEEGDYIFYLSENAHSWASIELDDSSLVYTWTLDSTIVYDEDNARESDLVAAVNQFDEVSAVFVDEETEGSPLNMSRADFAGTFPTAPTEADMIADEATKTALETLFDPETDEELGNVEGSLVYSDTTPTAEADNGLSLIDLRGLDYDDEVWDLFLDQLNYSKVQNLLANAGYNTAEMTDVGKPSTLDYDGPMGWTTWVTADDGDAVCLGFPAEEVLAATWNTELAYEMGEMVGEQGLYNGFSGWYAPGANIHRSAFAGRNYEYYSEDSLLSGKMAAEEISGAMEMGVFCYMKHFALNDKEDGRNGISVYANEQAIRELYLRPFEIAVKEATCTIVYNDENGEATTREISATTGIMSSYNRIGTTWAGACYALQTTILRTEWGFEGAVLSDYYGGDAYMNVDQGLRAGNDMMLNTFADGSLSDSSSATSLTAQRNAAHNILYMVANSNAMQGIASGSSISYALAGWQKALIAGDVVVGLLLVAGVVTLVRRKKARKAAEVQE